MEGKLGIHPTGSAGGGRLGFLNPKPLHPKP